MNRTKGILAAGTLTGLVLATILVFGFRNTSNAQTEATAVPPEVIVQPVVVPDGGAVTGGAENSAQSATYTQQLESALQTMQAREAQYQTQIEAANQTILQLQDEVNSQPAPASYTDDDRYEDDDDGRYEDDDDDRYEDDDDGGYDNERGEDGDDD